MERRKLTHEEAALNMPAFVLGVLEPDVAKAMSLHVASCKSCQEDRHRLELTVDAIGVAAPHAAPPTDLRRRVLDQLDSSVARSVPVERASQKPALSLTRRLAPFGLAAAPVLLIGLFAWVMLLRHDLHQAQGSLSLARQRQGVDTELLAGVSQMIPLVTDSAPTGYGNLYVGTQPNRALLVVKQLPPTPADKMYQVWLVHGSTRVAAGLFTVDRSGSATVMITAPDSLLSYDSLGITTEPSPHGSSAPTGPRIIGCSLK